jgi:hypothetical protein
MQFLKISNNVLIQSSLAFWCQGTAQRVLMSLTIAILFMPSTLAKSLDKYCVSRIGQKQEPRKFDSYAENNPKQLTIRTHSGLFDVSVDHSSLVLKRKGSSTRLSEFKIPPNNYSLIIESITLTKGQWLWVNGFEIDFMIAVNTSATIPTFGKPTWFPKIYSRPCSMFADFFGNCLRAQGVYSKSLGRAFVEGHRVNFFGFSEPVSFEMMEGTVKPLPKILQGARFVSDVPQLKGVLFRGVLDEALFYDGTTITTLPSPLLNQSKNNKFVSWGVENTQSEQTFILHLGYLKNPKDSLFLSELKAGPILKPIVISDEIENGWINLFKLSHNSYLWGVTRHRVVAEVRGTLQTVIKVQEPFYIGGPSGFKQLPDGRLTFAVRNLKKISSKSFVQYSIKKTSPTAQCKAILNAENPILLNGQ